MAGIYLHIPFCKKKCYYCDFYSIVSLKKKQQLVQSIQKELKLQYSYLGNDAVIKTIYFGGGTPSLLTVSEIESILKVIHKNYWIASNPEITLEANPDDLPIQYLRDIKKAGINRLSIGVQSFNDEDLMYLNRRHNAKQSVNCMISAYKAGFDNISIDLIYGLEFLTLMKWRKTLEKAFSFNIKHLSAYHLTIEPGTLFYRFLKDDKIHEIDEEKSIKQFECLISLAEENNFIHYEISNFARDGFFSRHNSNYWKGESYLGVGPSANSYNGISRQWNMKNINIYIESINAGKIPCEKEVLSERDKYNEYILTRFRTIDGVNTSYITETFSDNLVNHFNKVLGNYIDNKIFISKEENSIVLSPKGKFISDRIIEEFIY